MGPIDDDNSDNDDSKLNRSDLTNLEDLGFFIHEQSTEFASPEPLGEAGSAPSFPNQEQAFFTPNPEPESEVNPELVSEPNPEPLPDFETDHSNPFSQPLDHDTGLPFTPFVPEEAPANNELEDLGEVKSFGENLAYGTTPTGGNPPFSLLLQNLDRPQDREEVVRILREYDIMRPDNESIFLQSMEKGSVLISQISEFAAVYLAHQLRHLQVEILVALTDDLHPSKFYRPQEAVGTISKENLQQNVDRSENVAPEVGPEPIVAAQILISHLPFFESKKIEQYGELLTAQLELSDEEYQIRASIPDEPAASVQHGDGPSESNSLFQGLAKLSRLVYGTFDLSSPSAEAQTSMPSTPRSKEHQEQLLIEQLRLAASKLHYHGIVSLHFRTVARETAQGGGQFLLVGIGNGVILS